MSYPLSDEEYTHLISDPRLCYNAGANWTVMASPLGMGESVVQTAGDINVEDGEEARHPLPAQSAHTTAGEDPQPSYSQSLSINMRSDVLILLPQDHIFRGQKLPLPGLRLLPPISFQQGICLQLALQNDFSGLEDPRSPAWTEDVEFSAKVTFIFNFPGYARYRRQVHVLYASRLPPTRSKLALVVAREMERFLADCNRAHNPFRCGDVDLTLANLFLVDVRHISKGSLQPTIAVRVHCPPPQGM